MADQNSTRSPQDVNLPASRAEAKRLGASRYANGRPCKKGHVAERLTVNGSCCECSRLKSKAKYWASREEQLRYQKRRRDADPDLPRKKRERRYRNDPAMAERQRIRQAELEARQAAKDAGQKSYTSPAACKHGHEPIRFSRDGKCVECNRLACAARHARKQDPAEVARKEQERQAREARKAEKAASAKLWHEASRARQAAIESGSTTYHSPKPCPAGHIGERYTSGGSCVECLAIFSASEGKKQYDAVYYRENWDRIRARGKVYNEANREQRVIQAKRWRKENPEKRKAIIRNYSARRRAREANGISTAELHAWTAGQKKVCYWCGSKCARSFHVDHYVPLSKGGAHEADNLVIACPTCNVRKNAKDPYEFANNLGRLF